MHGDLEGARGEVASPSNVIHHLVESSVITGDRVPARDMPHDIVGEDMDEPAVVSRRPGFVLSAKKRLVPMHRKTVAHAGVEPERSRDRSGTRRHEHR